MMKNARQETQKVQEVHAIQGGQPAYRLEELIDGAALERLLTVFCDLVGVAAAIIDLNGKVLVAARWQKVCTDFYRANAKSCAHCIDNENHLAHSVAQGQPYAIHRCKNGLTDAAAPIIVAGQHLANVFVGQFLLDAPRVEFFARQAQALGFDPEAHAAALNEVPVVDARRVPLILEFASRFAVTVAQIGQKYVDARRLIEEGQRTLSSVEAFYRHALENVPDGLFLIDSEQRIVLVNEGMQTMFGYAREELEGRHFSQLMPEPAVAAHTAHWASYLAAPRRRSMGVSTTGAPLSLMARKKDGSLFPVELALSPLARGSEQLTHIAVSLRDVTERRAAAEKIAEQTRLLHQLMEGVTYPIFYRDADSTLITANQAYYDFFGSTAEAMQGCKYDAALAGSPQVSDDELERVMRRHQKVIDSRQPVREEYQMQLKNGQRRDVISLNSPATHSDGSVRGVIGSLVDITSQKDAERAIAALEERSRLVLNAASDGIIEVDQDGLVRMVNPAALTLLGYREEELLGHDLHALAHHSHLDGRPYPREDCPMHQSRVHGRPAFADHEVFWRKEGRAFPVEYRTGPVRRDDGVAGFVVSFRDISERVERDARLAENQLRLEEAIHAAEAATHAKTDFLANMSHEIRTPMNGVIGFAHLLQRTELTEQQRDYVTKIMASAEHQLGIVNDILDFSKIEAGKLDLEHIGVAVEALFTSIASLVAPLCEKKGLELVVNIAADVPDAIVGDPLRLKQILINLASNAIKFTDQGEVVLSVAVVKREGAAVTLRFAVQDSGRGMTQEQQSRLFQAFSQADSSITRQFGGTGLGLSISKALVNMMGGEIGVHSVEGRGSTFHFVLPTQVGELSDQPLPLGLTELLHNKRVLVVDDSAAAGNVAREMLERFGLAARATWSGQEALQMLAAAAAEKQPFDVLLLDWKMPDMDGLEVAHCVQTDARIRPKPALLLASSYGVERIAEQARSMGFQRCLTKPLCYSTLFDAIVNLFGASLHEKQSTQKTFNPDALARHLAGARILMAEDNEINQQVGAELLAAVGIQADIASNGKIAVAMACAKPYELVLMDMQMPEMDGVTATRLLRETFSKEALPIVALTANAIAAELKRCIEAGMNDTLTKPIDPSQLYNKLLQWLPERAATPAANVEMPAAAPAVAEEAALPVIDGLDAATGLSRLMGKMKLYRDILQRFSASEKDAVARIRAALAADDPASAERAAHTLKGVAGSIGATRIQALALEAERAIKAGVADVAGLADTLDAIDKELRQLIPALCAWLEQPAAAPARPGLDAAQLAAEMARLAALLADQDSAALTLFETIEPALKARFCAAADAQNLADLGAAIQNFDFSAAEVATATLAAQLA